VWPGSAAAEGEGTGYGTRGPRLRFDAALHDFGDLRDDQDKVSYDWVFHNDGDEPLRILGTRPSCGCTASVVTDPEVLPGGHGVLRVTFDPAGQHGSVRKTLSVNSNDPTDPHVLLTIKAKVTVVERPLEPGAHPRTTGQSLLMGDCASCHAEPAADKRAEALYTAVCAMCHGEQAEGGEHGPSLRTPDYLATRDDQELGVAISYGTSNPGMPGFSRTMGGPLTDEQILSLVEVIRRWGPLSAPSPEPGD
jgi:cytochrome c553